jgi:putative chitinase
MDISILRQCTGASLVDATKFATIIETVFTEFNIKNKAMFLAQVGHESGGLHWLKEIWGPTPTQTRYEGRKDLGNTSTGDGKKFMGRGLIQTTGKSNYAIAALALDLDLLEHPELLELPINAARSAGFFWQNNKLDSFSDIKVVTKKINGGYNGLAERTALYNKAVTLL